MSACILNYSLHFHTVCFPSEKNDFGTKSTNILIYLGVHLVFVHLPDLNPCLQKGPGPLSVSFATLSSEHRMVVAQSGRSIKYLLKERASKCIFSASHLGILIRYVCEQFGESIFNKLLQAILVVNQMKNNALILATQPVIQVTAGPFFLLPASSNSS